QGNLTTLHAVTEASYAVARLQPSQEGRHASFRVDETESLSAEYDLDLATGTADPRVSHTLSWGFDAYGVASHTAAVSYPRRGVGHDAEQRTLAVVVTETAVLHQDEPTANRWHIGVPWRTKTWELTSPPAWNSTTNPATLA